MVVRHKATAHIKAELKAIIANGITTASTASITILCNLHFNYIYKKKQEIKYDRNKA